MVERRHCGSALRIACTSSATDASANSNCSCVRERKTLFSRENSSCSRHVRQLLWVGQGCVRVFVGGGIFAEHGTTLREMNV